VPKGPLGLAQGLALGRKLSQFFFFFVWAGTLWALVTSPLGPEKLLNLKKSQTARPSAGKTEVFSGKVFSGKLKHSLENKMFSHIFNLPIISVKNKTRQIKKAKSKKPNQKSQIKKAKSKKPNQKSQIKKAKSKKLNQKAKSKKPNQKMKYNNLFFLKVT
jgi:hypothetical protein